MRDYFILSILILGLTGWLIVKTTIQRFLRRQSYSIALRKQYKRKKVRYKERG